MHLTHGRLRNPELVFECLDFVESGRVQQMTGFRAGADNLCSSSVRNLIYIRLALPSSKQVIDSPSKDGPCQLCCFSRWLQGR